MRVFVSSETAEIKGRGTLHRVDQENNKCNLNELKVGDVIYINASVNEVKSIEKDSIFNQSIWINLAPSNVKYTPSKFQIGERVKRRQYVSVADFIHRYGTIIREYQRTSQHPELYEVLWEDGQIESGFLPHGLHKA